MKSSSTALTLPILQQHLGTGVAIARIDAASGGCINQTSTVTLADGSRYFLKVNQASLLEMFAAEADGLNAIRASASLRAPESLGYGVQGQQAYLLLEYLPLQNHGDQRQAGTQLAALHRHTAAQHGWFRSNTIGASPQRNTQTPDWVQFWQQERLGFQLERARRNGYPPRSYEQGLRLKESIGALFTDYQPVASLLHGDLWGGNLAYLPDGSPVVYDPAVYYGDRETDLAMTELFGGFGVDFYAAYNAAWALDSGYAVRKTLYNLYHILNHFNLFGSGYGEQAARMTEKVLAEIG
ncbi:fructosamine kinase family protein [Thiothrix subterranea]|uniref:Fructosamine kinase family protein n=1 Tax=Thiothrix subterranea TaxID=2735563 RepID=A0AA51R5U8_9GAMM|nr:fructosamine kinase family protein [Thiothrix subterranea]MDQ5767097.1 fructosamine kinase family protein [Thiothrix subterranea]WML88041.1 fructosamine kinase family protein [Thiothrix subterranea]